MASADISCLGPREVELVRRLAHALASDERLSIQQLARAMDVGNNTISLYLRRCYDKLGFSRRDFDNFGKNGKNKNRLARWGQQHLLKEKGA